MQAVNWLDRREIPSRSSARKVIGIVAAVLAVLTVLAITLSDPRRNRTGDIRATTHIWSRYQTTWIASPTTTTTISQINEAKTRIPSFWPTLAATIPKTASGYESHHPEQDLHQELEADREQIDHDSKRRFAAGLLAVPDFHQPDPQRQREHDQLRQMVLSERLADAFGNQVHDELGGGLLGEDRGGGPGFDQRRTQPGPDQVRQCQTDQHCHQRVDQIKNHHEGAHAASDLIGDDGAQDREDDQRGRQGGQGAENQFGHDLQVGRAFTPENPDGNRHHDRQDDPGVERQPSRPALRFVLDDGRWSLVIVERGILGHGHRGLRIENSRGQRLAGRCRVAVECGIMAASPARCECPGELRRAVRDWRGVPSRAILRSNTRGIGGDTCTSRRLDSPARCMCHVLPHEAADGPANMALDEALLERGGRRCRHGLSAHLRLDDSRP